MKRLGASEKSLRHLLETGITVESICEELFAADPVKLKPADIADLRQRGFDRFGLKTKGRVSHYVELTAHEFSLKNARPILVENIVAQSTPLWLAMDRLAAVRWLFVLTPEGLTHIVTLADLAKQPARLLMFGLISLLEMVMLEIIRRKFTGEELQTQISADRLNKTRKLLNELQEKGQEIDLADCLQWGDKAAIIARMDWLRKRWEFKSKSRCDEFLDDVQDLRNQLAHAQHPAPDGDWSRVVHLLQKVDDLIKSGLEWLESQEK